MKNLSIFEMRDPAMSKCPECGEFKLRISKSRNGRDRMIKKIPCFGIYHCTACDWRGIHSELNLAENIWSRVWLSLLVIIIAAILISIIIKKFVPV